MKLNVRGVKLMYGNHDYETAKRIAEEKMSETGHEYVVLPTEEENL
jgi:hypothetical protein